MSSYNIIYKSPDKKTYLWSGTALDLLKSKDNENLYFSGKTFKHEDLEKELKQCLQTVNLNYPKDANPKVMPVEIKVSK